MRQTHIFIVAFFLVLFWKTSNAWLSPAMAKDKKEYDVKNIPAELLKDADAIVRKDFVRFEVINRKQSKEIVTRAITIFKMEKRGYGEILLQYDKFREVNDLEGKIFDADGEEIRELKNDDIKDYSLISGYAFFADDKAKSAELYHDKYPYTVEFAYEIDYKGSLQWPDWNSQTTLDPVEQSRFEVVVSEDDTLRYWCSTDTIKPIITIDGSKIIYVWESKNLPKLSKDVVGNHVEDVSTEVRIAPSLFEMGDYPGDMRTWKEFGTWDYNLIKGRDKLPESAVRDIHTLIQPTDDIQAKIKKLYRYMQDRTRYVSVKLGIGGWQPFDAAFVHEHGYGDCKALSNYMVALLKETGITAYPFLIHHGNVRLPFIKEFPSSQFNHVMVCVPLSSDTLWLECTSQTIPYGHISDLTENRGALLITPEGGVPIQTPKSTQQQNLQKRSATATLSFLGKADVRTVITRCGNQQDFIRNALDDTSPQDKERWIINSLGVPNAQLNNYQIEGLDTHELTVTLSMQLTLPRFASASGDRIFFLPNMMQRQTYIPPDIAQRLSPIRYDYPYLDVDTIFYSLPNGYTIESIPAETTLESSFGRYHSQTIAYGDTAIIYIRSKEIREYSIPAENYSEYRKFSADIVKADKAQVVLVRKNR
jgi:hypothetical protein